MKSNYKILFITNSLNIGGVETLLLRMSNWLVNNDYEVKILSQKKGNLIDKFDSRVNIRIAPFYFRLLFIPVFAKQILKNSFFKEIEIIYTFRPRTFWVGSIIARSLNNSIKLYTGVYHPREYWLNGVNDFRSKYYSELFNNYLDDQNKIFMSKVVKVSHESFFNRTYTKSNILPLAIESKELEKINRKPNKKKIVSIGRLINFKSYNIFMISVIKDLILEGYDVSYDIYGDGPDRDKINQIISDLDLEQYIKLRGEIDYFQMTKVLEDAYIFIGMGTALIEAGYSKVPSIVCIEGLNLPCSYGYIYDMVDHNIGEQDILNNNYLNVKDLIVRILNLSEEFYNLEMEKTYSYVSKYKMDEIMHNFCSIIKQSTIHSITIEYPLKKYYFFIYENILHVIKRILYKIKQLG